MYDAFKFYDPVAGQIGRAYTPFDRNVPGI